MNNKEYRESIDQLNWMRGVDLKHRKENNLDIVYSSILYKLLIDSYPLFYDKNGISLGKIKPYEIFRIFQMARLLYKLIKEIVEKLRK